MDKEKEIGDIKEQIRILTLRLRKLTFDTVNICPICNSEFAPDKVSQIYCSKKCRVQHKNKLYRDKQSSLNRK